MAHFETFAGCFRAAACAKFEEDDSSMVNITRCPIVAAGKFLDFGLKLTNILLMILRQHEMVKHLCQELVSFLNKSCILLCHVLWRRSDKILK